MSHALTNQVLGLSAGLVKLSASGKSSIQCFNRQQPMLGNSGSSLARVSKQASRRLRCQASQQVGTISYRRCTMHNTDDKLHTHKKMILIHMNEESELLMLPLEPLYIYMYPKDSRF